MCHAFMANQASNHHVEISLRLQIKVAELEYTVGCPVRLTGISKRDLIKQHAGITHYEPIPPLSTKLTINIY